MAFDTEWVGLTCVLLGIWSVVLTTGRATRVRIGLTFVASAVLIVIVSLADAHVHFSPLASALADVALFMLAFWFLLVRRQPQVLIVFVFFYLASLIHSRNWAAWADVLSVFAVAVAAGLAANEWRRRGAFNRRG